MVAKKICLAFVILTCMVVLNAQSSKSKVYGYDVIEITENMYRINNWHLLTENGEKLLAYYKTETKNGVKFITDVIYVLWINNDEIKILGEFSKSKSFVDSKGTLIDAGVDLNPNSNFFKKMLLGLSDNFFKYPFNLYGIVEDPEDKSLHQTEILLRLKIDEEKQSIAIRYIEF